MPNAHLFEKLRNAEDELVNKVRVNESLRKEIIALTTRGLKQKRDAEREIKSAEKISESSRAREVELHVKLSHMTNENHRLVIVEREMMSKVEVRLYICVYEASLTFPLSDVTAHMTLTHTRVHTHASIHPCIQVLQTELKQTRDDLRRSGTGMFFRKWIYL